MSTSSRLALSIRAISGYVLRGGAILGYVLRGGVSASSLLALSIRYVLFVLRGGARTTRRRVGQEFWTTYYEAACRPVVTLLDQHVHPAGLARLL